MPSNRRNRSSRSSQNRNQNPADRLFVASHHSGARGDILTVADDLQRRMPSWMLTQSPPKVIRNRITWIEDNTNILHNSVSGSASTFFNLSFEVSNFPTANALCASFDQYCIYAVIVRLTLEAGTTTAAGTVVTAIDYDSTATISYAQTLAYESANESQLIFGKSYERFIKPTVIPDLSSGSSATAAGVARLWVDSLSTNIPHYGYRSAFQGNTPTAIFVDFSLTAVFGFRNSY